MIPMQYKKITATELARNIASSIDQVRISGQPLYITKGSKTVAELCPPPQSGYPVEKLAELLASLPRLDEDAESLSKDIRRIKKQAAIPDTPWD
jgi:antitoxin (DNA-binding transcriptional repressor) of toxin-antitoxin stability system